jgi:hypothetical protein
MVPGKALVWASSNDILYGAWEGARLGLIQLYLGEPEAAQRSLESALQFFEVSPSNPRPNLEAMAILSEVALVRGNLQVAVDHMQASLAICEGYYRQLQATPILSGTPEALPLDFIGLCARAALVAAAQGHTTHGSLAHGLYARAITLHGIADSLLSQSKQRMIPQLKTKLDESMAVIRSQLPQDVLDVAWETGQKLTLPEAFEFLLS